jgi:NADPH:quinone reductase-like Zn-dependent oxidoreductase
MKAVLQTKYGSPDVLKFIEADKPFPRQDQVLIKVQAIGLNMADWRLLAGSPFFIRLMGLGKGKIPGSDLAGQVQSIGQEVEQFRPGDEVYGDILSFGSGAFAEYVCVPEKAVAKKPTNLSFEQAAAVPMAALTALQGLRDVGQIQPGQSVMIYGASGGVGTFSVQIAKAFGAEVTAVCSTGKMDMVRSLGADHVIDYTREDFTKNGQCYDLILAANGYRSIWKYRRALNPKGIYVMAGGTMNQIFQAVVLGRLLSRKGGKTLFALSAKASQQDLITINALIEAGSVTPLIDRCYPFTEIREALRYLGEGHVAGKVVVTMSEKQP